LFYNKNPNLSLCVDSSDAVKIIMNADNIYKLSGSKPRKNNDKSKVGPSCQLKDGDHVAVIGGGPAGSFFSSFFLDMAQRVGLDVQLDIYEPRDFDSPGPLGCNMCAGIISESLIQALALEGINLPPKVIQRGMDTYIMHTNFGNIPLKTPNLEKRIGAVFRGAGPKGNLSREWRSFDGFILEQALTRGANLVKSRVEDIDRQDRGFLVKARGTEAKFYNFVVIAAGVNTNALKFLQHVDSGYKQPVTVQTFVREYYVGYENIKDRLGEHNIHFFLLDLPGLDFAAIIPKGDYVTVTLLGEGLNKELFEKFLSSPVVKECMPSEWDKNEFDCQCSPRINITGAIHPYTDRMVFLGDSGVSRLYKDGIGAAYRAAKYAASATIFHGIGESDLNQHYWLKINEMEKDNRVGKYIFALVRKIKHRDSLIKAMSTMVASEQESNTDDQPMSKIMWDLFTGSAPYQEIFNRLIQPKFFLLYVRHIGSLLLRRA